MTDINIENLLRRSGFELNVAFAVDLVQRENVDPFGVDLDLALVAHHGLRFVDFRRRPVDRLWRPPWPQTNAPLLRLHQRTDSYDNSS